MCWLVRKRGCRPGGILPVVWEAVNWRGGWPKVGTPETKKIQDGNVTDVRRHPALPATAGRVPRAPAGLLPRRSRHVRPVTPRARLCGGDLLLLDRLEANVLQACAADSLWEYR
jgi:hypothetical protein